MRFWIAALLAGATLSAIGGCRKPPPAPKGPAPMTVTVSHPIEHEVVQWDEFDGHVASPGYVEVEAQVTGQILKEPFDEGSVVQAGQTLFEIDPATYKATYEQRVAAAAKSQAQLGSAQSDFDKDAEAFRSHAISQQVYDNARYALDQSKAQFAADQAATDAAKTDLNRCNVVAPITGKVGRKQVTVGNVVVSGTPQPTVLTTIQSIDPMYCNVDVDEASVQRYRELALHKQQLVNAQGQVPCYLQLDDETGFPHTGYIDFSGNAINTGTGTLPMRGVFANPPLPGLLTGALLPGNHAVMRIAGSPLEKTLLVPDDAIGTNQNIRFVLAVTPDNHAALRPVQLGALFGKLRSITSGLKPDDQVIIDGGVIPRIIPFVTPVIPSEGKITFDPADFALPAGLPATQPTTEPATAPATQSSNQQEPAQ